MSLLLKTIVLFSFTVAFDEGLNGSTLCYSESVTQRGETFQCNGLLFQPVCLICNESRTVTALGWYTNDTRLTHNQFALRGEHAGGIDVNQCDSKQYSLRLKKPSTENDNALYTCSNSEGIVSQFKLNLKANTTLIINSTRISDGQLLIHRQEGVNSLQCIIKGSVPPFTLIWSLNGVEQVKKTFKYSGQTPFSELYLDTRHLRTDDVVTCSSKGRYIASDNSSLQIDVVDAEDDLSSDDVSRPFGNQLVLITSAAVIVSVVVIYFVVRGMLSRHLSNRDNFGQGGLSNTNSENVSPTPEPYYYIQNLAREAYSESGLVRDNLTICLETKVTVNGLYEYWIGTYRTESLEQGKCFAKQLSDQGTLREASEFKTLAKELLALKKSATVTSVLSINIEKEPFSIVYELLEYGSLRDFVISRYQHLQTEDVERITMGFKDQVQELLTFAVNIAKALEFLESQEFCHPLLSLKKVLLTSDCACKLYDICSNNIALSKVKQALNKQNPPVAWMPPETIFLGEYTTRSDAWSFSVLLWELFTLGETPFARNTNAEIGKYVREGNILPKPHNCPGSVYETMLLSWQTNFEMRPSFSVWFETLKGILKTYQEANASKRVLYSTLDPKTSGDSI